MMDRLLTTREVAARLGVDPKTVLRYLRQQKLKGSRIGRDYRISESSVNVLLMPTPQAAEALRSCLVIAVASSNGSECWVEIE